MNQCQNRFEEDLLSAIESENMAALQHLHASNADFQSYCNRRYSRPLYQQLTPISIACAKGFVDIALFLLENAKIDLEIRNNYEIERPGGGTGTYIGVKVLWIAVINKNFDLVRLLVDHGAKVNETSGSTYDALRWAISNGNEEIVQYLTKHSKTDEDPRCKLQTAVEKEDFNTVRDLVERMAVDVNEYDGERLSPLELAVKQRSVLLIGYLLEHGARNVPSRSGQLSPLLTAVEERQTKLMKIISPYCSLREQIEAKELLASQFASGRKTEYDFHRCLTYLREAIELRSLYQLAKEVKSTMLPLIHHRDECRTLAELEEVANNSDEICIEALLIRERLLGTTSEAFRSSVGYRGAFLIDEKKFDQGLSLWFYEARLNREHSLQCEEVGVPRSIVVFREMLNESIPIDVRHVQAAFNLFSQDIADEKELYEWPMFIALCFVTTIARIIDQGTDVSVEDRQSLLSIVRCIVQRHYVMFAIRYTLLHIAAFPLNQLLSMGSFDMHYYQRELLKMDQYPCERTIGLLLEFGADVNSRDAGGNTALHILMATQLQNTTHIIRLLCEAGSHLDCVNMARASPTDFAVFPDQIDLLKSYSKLSLKCCCARLIRQHQIPLDAALSGSLTKFVQMH